MTLKEAIELLRSSGVPSPEYDARELFKHFGHKSGGMPTLSSSSESEELAEAIKRRSEREPLQYILGSVGFYREEYKVSPRCLIPRSDTEILVDYAVSHIPAGERFADLCCGSGCIGISTLSNTKSTRCISVDISDGALALTEENAKLNGVQDRIKLVKANLLEDVLDIESGLFAVLSNPPYIPLSVYEGLEKEIFSEPKIAFVGGNDGLAFYRRLIPLSLKLTRPEGFIALEIGFNQANDIRLLAEANGCACEILKDYSQNDRVAVLRRKSI